MQWYFQNLQVLEALSNILMVIINRQYLKFFSYKNQYPVNEIQFQCSKSTMLTIHLGWTVERYSAYSFLYIIPKMYWMNYIMESCKMIHLYERSKINHYGL
jgi:hypothetical protein